MRIVSHENSSDNKYCDIKILFIYKIVIAYMETGLSTFPGVYYYIIIVYMNICTICVPTTGLD